MTPVYEQKRITKHDACPVELRVVGPHIGLYCQCHNKWLKWLTDAEARVALTADVSVKITATKKTNIGITEPTSTQYIKIQNKDKHRQLNRLRKQRRWQEYRQLKRSNLG